MRDLISKAHFKLIFEPHLSIGIDTMLAKINLNIASYPQYVAPSEHLCNLQTCGVWPDFPVCILQGPY
jgi:hypothetical protein